MTALCGLDSCARPAPTAVICEQHWWELDRALRSVPDLLAELDTSLARQSKTTPAGEKVTGKGESAVAFGLAASEAGAGLRDALTGWADQLVGMPTGSARRAASSLLLILPEHRARTDLADLCDEILDAHHRATKAVDAPFYRSISRPLARCPEAACIGTLRGFVPADERIDSWIGCDINGEHRYDTAQWLRVGKRIRERTAA